MRRKRHAFTLIELLVVLAVIAILAGILLPALSNARKKAKAISCVSKQKQIAACYQLYASDFDEFAYGGTEWAVAMLPDDSLVKPYRDAGKISWSHPPTGQGYLGNDQILFCPEERISNLPEAGVYGNALTGAIQGDYPFMYTTIGTTANPDALLPIPMKNYISPSCSVLGGDCGKIDSSKYIYYSGIGPVEAHITLRHKNLANVFCADGHVNSVGKDLNEYYVYNVRGSASKDIKFTKAIKNQEEYELD